MLLSTRISTGKARVLYLVSIMYINIFLYRNIVIEHGPWDQLRVDHGREWFLILSIQQSLAHLRNDTTKSPYYIQTTSKEVGYYTNIPFSSPYLKA